MRILDRVKKEGKKVTSFVSWCGGLPEPAASNVSGTDEVKTAANR